MANTIKFTGKLEIELELSRSLREDDNEIKLICQEMKMEYIGKMVCISSIEDARKCYEIVKFYDTYFVFESYASLDKKYNAVFKSLPNDIIIKKHFEPLSEYKYYVECIIDEDTERWYYKEDEADMAIMYVDKLGSDACFCEI